jgi:Uma2 family endonuclease
VATTLIPIEEYLLRVGEGACPDYLDGVLVERKVGHYKHGRVQALIAGRFLELGKRIACFPSVECHLRLSARRYRVADLAVFFGQEPSEPIPNTPPYVAVEVLSPDDRFSDVMDKLEEYRTWGVPNIWFVDPWARKLSVYGEAGLVQVAELELVDYNFKITAAELFQ